MAVQGGILIKAPHQSEEPTSQVQFSLDEGNCWHTVELAEAIDVIGIRYAIQKRLLMGALTA